MPSSPWLLEKSTTPDTLARGITPYANEPMVDAAGDFDMHIVTDVVGSILTALGLGIMVAGIYGLIRHFKKSFKSEAFAQLGPAAAWQPIKLIVLDNGTICKGISFERYPYGSVGMRNLTEEELDEEFPNVAQPAERKGVLITMGGASVRKKGIDVEEAQKNILLDAYNHKTTYQEFLGGEDADLHHAIALYKLANGIALSQEETQKSIKAIALHKIDAGDNLTKDEIEFALTDCLKRIGCSEFDENDQTILSTIFNLSEENVLLNLTDDAHMLTDEEIQHVVSIRTNGIYDTQRWDPNKLRHFLSLFRFPFSEQLAAIYKIIFSEETIRNCIRLFRTLPTLKAPANSPNTVNYAFDLPDNTQIAVEDCLLQQKRSNIGYVQMTINGCQEKWENMNLSALYEEERSRQCTQACDDHFPQTKEFHNTILAELVIPIFDGFLAASKAGEEETKKTLEVIPERKFKRNRSTSLLVRADSSEKKIKKQVQQAEGVAVPKKAKRRSASVSLPTGEKSIKEQIKRDLASPIGLKVQTGSQRFSVPFADLVDDDLNWKLSDQPVTERTRNTVKIMVDQRYRTFFTGAINEASRSLGERMSQDSMEKFFNCTTVIPDDFEETRTLTLTGTQLIGSKTVVWEGKLTFLEDFFKQLEDGSVMDGTKLGIESACFTRLEWGKTVDELEQEVAREVI